MKNLNLTALFIAACLIVLPSSLSAELSGSQFEIIKIAFMNGYTNAIQGNIETILALKQDQEKLRKYSRIAVNRYMEKVALLNQDGQKSINKKDPVTTGSNSFSF